MKHNTKQLTLGALIAALYVALTWMQNLLLPGTTSMAIQFRASEALCVLAFFTPAAIPGLGLGCLLFNLTNGAMPWDIIAGSTASVLAAAAMYLTRKVTIKGYPLPGLLMPALFNAFLVGWMVTYYFGGGFWLNCLYVALGELGVLLTLGSFLFYALKKHMKR